MEARTLGIGIGIGIGRVRQQLEEDAPAPLLAFRDEPRPGHRAAGLPRGLFLSPKKAD